MKPEPTPAPLGPAPRRIARDDRAPSGWSRMAEVMWHLPRLLSGSAR
ncbi:MAG: hypothetical protein ABIN68_00240 [Sphingomicrobium sp.]